MDVPPAEEVCSVCHDRFRLPCQANCSHWFCGNCILRVWNSGFSLHPCKCPLCRRPITLLIPASSVNADHDTEAYQVLQNVEHYNRLFGRSQNSLIQVQDLPFFIRRLSRELVNRERTLPFVFMARMTLSVVFVFIYVLIPVDILPERIYGYVGFLDDIFLMVILFLHLAGVYRTLLLRRHGGAGKDDHGVLRLRVGAASPPSPRIDPPPPPHLYPPPLQIRLPFHPLTVFHLRLSSRRQTRHCEDLIFLLFSDGQRRGYASAFLPSRRFWIPFHLCHSLYRLYASDGSFVVGAAANCAGDIVCDALSNSMIHIVPQMRQSYILALIEDEASSNFKILAVGKRLANNVVYSHVYDSRSCRWELRGKLPKGYAILGNAVFLDGILFVLGRLPDHLLTFNMDNGAWSVVDMELPSHLLCWHLLAFEAKLFLVGGSEEEELTAGIGIWEIDLVEKEWRVFCLMPEEIFKEFSGNCLVHFLTVDRLGIVCLYKARDSTVVICDMSSKTWWFAPSCELIPKRQRSWIGHALEFPVQLLK